MDLTQEQINDIVTAVFSLMESQGMLPESQLDVIAQNVKRRLQLDSMGVDEVPVVDSVNGIYSLPCVRQNGSVFDIVRTPLSLLKGELVSLPLFRISSGYWQISETNGSTWKDITDSAGNRVSALGSKGDQGDSISLRTTETEIQWKSGNGEWELLIPVSDLGASTIGGLTDVSNDTGTATIGSLFVKGEEWYPVPPVLDTGTDYENMLMPVFNHVLGKWVFISAAAIAGGATPPELASKFPYTFPLTF